jgi:uncharacterized protein YceH (UPF0502 family)
MHRFEEIADVLAGLEKLMVREPALVAVLPRQPGTKDSRYAHLLSSKAGAATTLFPVSVPTPLPAPPPAAIPQATFVPRQVAPPVLRTDASPDDRLAQLEAEMVELRREMAALRQKIDDLFGD